MLDFTLNARYDCADLVRLVALLRGPGGCPWDAAQTHGSIRRNLLEEAYEACEAIDANDSAHLCEELGDVLLQVVFHAGIEQDAGRFDFADVCTGVCQKLIDRHPHLFQAGVAQPDWETLKQAQRGYATLYQTMEGVSKALPSLWRADKLLSKAEKAAQDGNNPQTAVEQCKQELTVLGKADTCADQREAALGRLLFAVVRLARSCGVDPEDALHKACNDYTDRFCDVRPGP